ncbi:MAG: cell division initiation protein [Desulfovibrionales bacterium]|jgi:cell division initiation protein|nr:cell division initiation protein [Desulfovibrionales bacterium]
MTLSKIDLINKKFSTRLMGYSRDEVDQLLMELAEVLGKAAEERRAMKQRLDHMQSALKDYRQREETLRDTLITTQKMVDDLKAQARKEAELILDEANAKGQEMIRQAHSRQAQVHEDILELKRQRLQFETQLKGLLTTHFRLLEMDPEAEKLEVQEAKVTYLKQAE